MEIKKTDDGKLECYVSSREGALIHAAVVGVLILVASQDYRGLSQADAIAVVNYVSETTGNCDTAFSIPETAAGIFSRCIKDYGQILLEAEDQAMADRLANDFWTEDQVLAFERQLSDDAPPED